MVHVRSAVVGSGATVAVAVGVFFAVSAGNAAEPVPVVVEAPVLVGHYSTIESVDLVEYVPEPVVEPVPVVTEEPIVVKPAPAPALEVAPQPAPAEPAPVQTFEAPPPETPGMPNPILPPHLTD